MRGHQRLHCPNLSSSKLRGPRRRGRRRRLGSWLAADSKSLRHRLAGPEWLEDRRVLASDSLSLPWLPVMPSESLIFQGQTSGSFEGLGAIRQGADLAGRRIPRSGSQDNVGDPVLFLGRQGDFDQLLRCLLSRRSSAFQRKLCSAKAT